MSKKVTTTHELADALEQEQDITVAEQIQLYYYPKHTNKDLHAELEKYPNTIKNIENIQGEELEKPSYGSPVIIL